MPAEFCKYNELYQYADAFCKFTKSDAALSEKCIEPHYIQYPRHGIVKDDAVGGHHMLSFVPIEKALLVMPYGDVYTELETSREIAELFCKDVPVQYIGGAFSEYRANQLYIRKNISLSEIQIHEYLLRKADDYSMSYAVAPVLQEARISNHLKKFGFSESAEYWSDIESFAKKQRKRTIYPKEICKAIREQFSLEDKTEELAQKQYTNER